MKVLSLFDGMSCGQIALDRLGIEVEAYHASEIDKYAIAVTTANYPDTIHLGDVRDVTVREHFDLIMFGSPCQGFSFSGKHLNFDDPRSALFFEAVRILGEARQINPDVKFLMENVRMKKESMKVITDALGVDPVAINSNLVSAQNRYRLYWTNLEVKGLPQDRGIQLKDIIEDSFITDRDKSHCLDANYFKGGNLKSYFEKHRRQLVFSKNGLCHVGDADLKGNDSLRRVYHPDGKSPTLTAAGGGNTEPKILQYPRGVNKGGLKALNGKVPSLTSSSWETNNHLTMDEGLTYRKLTPLECERLQTVPEGYTNHVSNTQRYKMLGNGWTIDVITHLLNELERKD